MAWSKSFSFIYSCMLAALSIQAVSPQAPANDQCESLLTPIPQQCTALEDCNGLQCTPAESLGNNVTAIFMVAAKCQDPVLVNLTVIEGPVDADDQRTLLSQLFTRNEVALLSGRSDAVSVTISRTASHLTFQAMSTKEATPVIPEVVSFLNVSDCMCASLDVLAGRAQHSLVEPDCGTNVACNGVRCELDFGILLYYVEVIVLPCENATEVVIEDRNRRPLHATNFTTQTGVQTFMIEGIEMTARVILEVYDYSMVIQASLVVPFFGEEEIIPRHEIILDRTACNAPLPTVVPSTANPVPIPLPENPSDTCLAFANIVSSA